jgi:predicted metal-dependent HD superfamily phosphohydrolase
MSVTLASWHSIWRALGAGAGDEPLFHRLVAAWSEPQRHYHTLQHLRECLDQLDGQRRLAQRPAEIALALWFHDAFYDPQRSDNEQRSAEWADEALRAAGLRDGCAARVHAMVMATAGHAPTPDPDRQLLVDIDLAILGAEPARFDESDAQIRAEYAHVPQAQWREGRGGVLRGFLARSRIYGTPALHERHEAQARANLQRALDRLARDGG